MGKRIVSRALTAALALLLAVTALAASVYLLATNEGVMLRLMQRYAPPEASHLPAADYPAMAEMICGYLRGECSEFQLTYMLDGTEYLAFHAHEQQHMADVQELFALCRRILWGGLMLSAALAAAVWLLRQRGVRRVFRWSVIGVLTALTLTAVLALADFDALFLLFHELAFTNDLWLLNPRTDLLIRLMPTEFFVAYAGLIGCAWLGSLLLMLGGSFLPVRKKNEGDENP